jgi:protein-L-isoaspartate O-methyltransferase
MVIPLGGSDVQELSVLTKDSSGATDIRAIMPVRFTRLEVAA